MQTLNQSLLDHILAIAFQAGEHLKQFYAKSVEIQIKADKTPVTEADLFISRFITEALKQLTPHIPVLSEEFCNIPLSERQQWQEYWIIDPLDGTQQFIDRTDQFSVVIGLVQQNKPVLGVIHSPILDKTYFAMQNHGCFLQENGQIRPLVAEENPSEQSPYSLQITLGSANFAPVEKCLLPPYHAQFFKYGSSSLKAGLVAEGKADCYVRFGDTGEWDTAVAEILLQEVGGEIFDLHFKPLTYNQRETFINPYFVMVRDRNRDWQKIFQFN